MRKIFERIKKVCQKSQRNTSEILVMAVTKGRSEEQIAKVYGEGFRLFGENRVQEAIVKANFFRSLTDSKLHMIGHLQSNKVSDAVQLFDVIESVDSLSLLAKIHDRAKFLGKPLRVFVQVNIARDPKKFGVLPDKLFEFFRNAHAFLSTGHIIVDGLMTIVEHTENIEMRRPFFRKMKKLSDELRSLFPEGHIEHVPLRYLSMGMSEDFEIAIEEGANLIRLGRAIFEEIAGKE